MCYNKTWPRPVFVVNKFTYKVTYMFLSVVIFVDLFIFMFYRNTCAYYVHVFNFVENHCLSSTHSATNLKKLIILKIVDAGIIKNHNLAVSVGLNEEIIKKNN